MFKKKVFVTVGTTKFPKLIDTITKKPPILKCFLELGYDFIQVQTGTEYSINHQKLNTDPEQEILVDGNTVIVQYGNQKIKIQYVPYFDNFTKEIESSDLIISHAGAGTCLEVLKKRKPLIVVVNEDLMDNHQLELAEQLENNGYLYYCTCDILEEVIKKDFSILKPYPEADMFLFSNYLNKCMGFME